MITQTSHHLLEDDPVHVESAKLSTGDTVFTMRLGGADTGFAAIAFHMTPGQAMTLGKDLYDHAAKAMVDTLVMKKYTERPSAQVPLPPETIRCGGMDG